MMLMRYLLLINGIISTYLIFHCQLVCAESLSEMVSCAKNYDARYLADRAEYESTAFRVDLARSKLLPSVNTSADVARNNLDVTYKDPRIKDYNSDYNTNDWTTQLIQPIFRLDEWFGLTTARRFKEQSLYNLRQAESELIMRLAQAYYDFLLAKETLEVLDAEQRALSERWLAAEGLHKSGVVAISEPLQYQARLLLVVADSLEAKWAVANKRRSLQAIAGPDVEDPDPVDVKEIEKNWGDLEEWIQRTPENPQVCAAKLSIEIAKEDELKSRAGFWPGVDAVGSYQDAYLGPTASFRTQTRNITQSVGFRASWPIFSGGGTLAQSREFLKRKEKAQAELLAAEREVGIQISEAYSGLYFGLEQLKALGEGVSVSEKIVRAMEMAHEAGARTLAQVLDSRQQLIEAKRNKSQAFYKLLLNQLKLHLVVGETDF